MQARVDAQGFRQDARIGRDEGECRRASLNVVGSSTTNKDVLSGIGMASTNSQGNQGFVAWTVLSLAILPACLAPLLASLTVVAPRSYLAVPEVDDLILLRRLFKDTDGNPVHGVLRGTNIFPSITLTAEPCSVTYPSLVAMFLTEAKAVRSETCLTAMADFPNLELQYGIRTL